MAVDRCVCHGVTFRQLKALAEWLGPDFERLSELTGCGTGCGLCRPYVERMLRTGETAFDVSACEPEAVRPVAARDVRRSADREGGVRPFRTSTEH